jgi:hypothetical protein
MNFTTYYPSFEPVLNFITLPLINGLRKKNHSNKSQSCKTIENIKTPKGLQSIEYCACD